MASVRLSIPETSEHKEVGESEKTFITYNIRIDWNDGRHKVIQRRFHEFREFDRVWSEYYPTVGERVKLPPAHSIIMTKSTIEKRRKKLEEYLNTLAEVRAIQPLLAQFLAIPESDITGPRGPRQLDLPDVPIEKWRGMEDAAQHIHGFKREETRADDAEKHGMIAIEENGETYYVPANTFAQTVDANNLTMNTQLTKGNTHAASERAKREKEEFLRKNAGIIASLMPGRQINFAYNVDRTGERNDRYMGRIQMSIWFRPGTGGDTRPVYTENDNIDDMGGGAVIIEIHSGMDLPSYDGITNPYVKLFLLPDVDRKSKQKTSYKTRTVNPTWEEVFEYRNVYPTELGQHSLSISVWDKRNHGKNVCLGEVLVTELSILPTTPQTKLSQWIDLRPFSNLVLDAATSPRAVTVASMKDGSSRSTFTFGYEQPKPALPSSPPPSLPSAPPPRVKKRPNSSTSTPGQTPTPSPLVTSQSSGLMASPPPLVPPQRSTPAAPTPVSAPRPTPFTSPTPTPPVSPAQPAQANKGPGPLILPSDARSMLRPTSTAAPPAAESKPPGLPQRPASAASSASSGPAAPAKPAKAGFALPARFNKPSSTTTPTEDKSATDTPNVAPRPAPVPPNTQNKILLQTTLPPALTPPPTASRSAPQLPQSANASRPAPTPPVITPKPSSGVASPPAQTPTPAIPPAASRPTPTPPPMVPRPTTAPAFGGGGGASQFGVSVTSSSSSRPVPTPPPAATTSTSAPSPFAAPPRPTPVPAAAAAAPAPSPTPPPVVPPKKNVYVASNAFEPDPAEAAQNSLMAFSTGEIITVVDGEDDSWWYGKIGTREGYFPKSFVSKMA